MNKKILCTLSLMLVFAGCSNSSKNAKNILLQDKNSNVYTLESSDDFKTASLLAKSNKKIDLKEKQAASGMKLASADGSEISLKGNEATLTLGNKNFDLVVVSSSSDNLKEINKDDLSKHKNFTGYAVSKESAEPNGEYVLKEKYVDGKLNGYSITYLDNKVEEIAHYVNGLRHGLAASYDKNGNVINVGNYVNGELKKYTVLKAGTGI